MYESRQGYCVELHYVFGSSPERIMEKSKRAFPELFGEGAPDNLGKRCGSERKNWLAAVSTVGPNVPRLVDEFSEFLLLAHVGKPAPGATRVHSRTSIPE